MFNTLPSNSVAGGASSASGGIQGVPILFPPVAVADRYDDIQTYFDDSSAAQIDKFGPRYQWIETGLSHTAAWVDVFNLTGPGVMQFLAIWESASGESKVFNLRIIVDGTVVTEVLGAWSGTGSSSIDAGYIPVGSVFWDGTSAPVSGYTPPMLENIPYASSFQVQVNCSTSAVGTSFKALYRAYDAK